MESKLHQHIVEIRHATIFTLADNRGFLAEVLSSQLDLKVVSFTDIGISLQNEDSSIIVAIDPTRIGISTKNLHTDDIFKGLVTKTLSLISSLSFYKDKLLINRIGLRIRSCYEYKKSFDKLRALMVEKYMPVPKKILDEFKMEVIDIGYPINFKDGDYRVNTNCGPMETDQLKQWFYDFTMPDVKFPEVGLYIDVDYAIVGNGIEMRFEDINKKLLESSFKCREKTNIIKRLVLD